MPRREFLDLSAILHHSRHSLSSSPSKESGKSQSTPWRPMYLRRLFLISFILVACAIVAALEVLNHISQSQNGFASSIQRLHYVWTYTPTAILTIMSALWARTEFQAKQNAPWRSLQQPEKADKNLLLDYDTLPPVALWKSFKHRHFIVAAGIACSLLLQLATLFSTSLLSLQRVHVARRDVPVQLSDFFDGDHPEFNDTTGRFEAFDVLNQVQFENLSYPSGTNKNFAFQRFSIPSDPQTSVVTAPIRAMEAYLECEHATLEVDLWKVSISNDTWGGNQFPFYKNRIMSPSCTIFNQSIHDFTTKGLSLYKARVDQIVCENSTDTDRNRLWLSAVQYHKGRLLKNSIQDPPTFWTKTWELVLDRSVQLFCKPRLRFINMQATSNLSDSSAMPDLKKIGTEPANFANLNAWNITDQVMQGSGSYDAADRPIATHNTFFDLNSTYRDGKDPETNIDFRIQLGGWIAGKQGSSQKLFSDGVLEEVVSAFYRSMAAQVIHKGLVKSGTTQVNGSVISEDNRVLVMQSPLRVLEVCLLVSILMAVAMVLLGPNDGVLSQNPSNILTIVNIMSNSENLRKSLYRTGSLPFDALGYRLRENKYSLRDLPQGTLIEADTDSKNHGFNSRNECMGHQPSSSWKPFPSIWWRVSIFSMMAGAILALEVLLHISQKRNGLGEASNDGRLHYLWTTVPSLAMMLIGLSIGSIDSNTRALAPYACLQRAKGVSFEILATNFLDTLRITNLFRSARARNHAVFLTTLAALIASFLTIVTSGLFSAVEVSQTSNLNFTQKTLFTSPNISAITADVPSLILSHYIINDNLTYPRWTYEDLVFPELSLPSSDSEYSNSSTKKGTYADINVMAIRSSSDCVFATGNALNYSIGPNVGHWYPTYGATGLTGGSDGPWLGQFNITMDFPKLGCPQAEVPGSNGSWLQVPSSTKDSILLAQDGYFAQTYPIGCTGTDEARMSSMATYIWGYFQNHTMHHISSMTCAGKIESIDTVTRFQLPDFDIHPDHPPIVDESSVKAVPDINGVWDIYKLDLLDTRYDDGGETKENINIDRIFTSLLQGRYKIPKVYLRRPEFDGKVQEAIKRLEGISRAQPLKTHARMAVNGTLNQKPRPGNLTSLNHVRVFQDAASTRVLEVMLGVILLLSILGSVLMNTDGVLPKNPMSIAAVGSLLADSNFLHLCSSREQNSNYGLLRRCQVHLGWLDDEYSSESSSSEHDDEKGTHNRYLTIYASIKEGFIEEKIRAHAQSSSESVQRGADIEHTSSWI